MTRVTKFRDGDVVRHTVAGEGIVVAVRGDGLSDVDVAFGPNSRIHGETESAHAQLLTLLRRPVREGDLLVSWLNTSLSVREVRDRCYRGWHSDGHESALAFGATGWTHADGTPIEPPKAEEKPSRIEREIAIVKAVWGETKTRHGWALERGQDVVRCPDCLFGMHAEHTTGNLARYDCPNCKDAMPTVERLARALFETDPRVKAFVDHVGERPTSWDEAWEKRRLDVTQKAWDRNESRMRDDAEQRASEIRAVLLQSEGKER